MSGAETARRPVVQCRIGGAEMALPPESRTVASDVIYLIYSINAYLRNPACQYSS